MNSPSPTTRAISYGMHLAFVATCILAIALARVPAASAADMNAAGLVVDYGDGRVSYAWVPFEEEEISGIELLRRSGLDLVTVGFGGMGEAVCQIDDTGCPLDECRGRLCQTSDPESPFWHYSRQTVPGEWELVALGASGTTVRDGDIDGWSWTGGEAVLPPLTMEQLADRAGADASLLNATDLPPVALQTHGGETGRVVPAGAASGVVALGVIGLVAGLVVWRSRRARSSHA